MVTNNLRYYDSLLLSGRPLFTVEALLSPPEIILHPHASELFKLMTQAMLEVVEGYVVVVVQTQKNGVPLLLWEPEQHTAVLNVSLNSPLCSAVLY